MAPQQHPDSSPTPSSALRAEITAGDTVTAGDAITAGDTVSIIDRSGITWFGIAETGVQRTQRWPTVRVDIGGRTVDVPARDVARWPVCGAGPPPPGAAPAAARTGSRRVGAQRIDPSNGGSPPEGTAHSSGAHDGERFSTTCPITEPRVGDSVVFTEEVCDKWYRRIRPGARGVVVGRTRDGCWLIRLTTAWTAVISREHITHCIPAPFLPSPGARSAPADGHLLTKVADHPVRSHPRSQL